MIRVFTKSRHKQKISKFLDSLNQKYEIFTIHDQIPSTNFDLGISYCYPRKISESLLSIPTKGFVNYHPAPLPKYKGPTELSKAIKNQEMDWGVTVHHMDENYDTGDILKIKKIKLHEPPTDEKELGAISHYFLFQLFKESLMDIFEQKLSSTPQIKYKES
jgi:methionyl-tRNA formyltransferase